jgi:uncharacterized membrane protein YgdD (TMEM256/DUF423 family)
MSVYPKFSAALGALGVALGAFGAHGLKQTLDLHQTGGIWQTASLYHLLHSVALLSLCSRSPGGRKMREGKACGNMSLSRGGREPVFSRWEEQHTDGIW